MTEVEKTMTDKFKSKWWLTMLAKHGSEQAVRDFMRQGASKSSRNSKGTGGFAYLSKHDPERLKEISRAGGKVKRAKTD